MYGFYRTPRSGNRCVLALYSILIFFCTISILSTITWVVRPYRWAANFKETTCNITKIEQKGYGSCQCSHFCVSSFPCIRVIVTFRVKDSIYTPSLVHEDEVTALKGFNCTFHPKICSTTYQTNANNLQRSSNFHLVVNTKLQCYYDQGTLDHVILRRYYSTANVIFSLLIPCCLLLMAGLGCIHSSHKINQTQQLVSPSGIEALPPPYPGTVPDKYPMYPPYPGPPNQQLFLGTAPPYSNFAGEQSNFAQLPSYSEAVSSTAEASRRVPTTTTDNASADAVNKPYPTMPRPPQTTEATSGATNTTDQQGSTIFHSRLRRSNDVHSESD